MNVMPFLVLTYPILLKEDFEWIQNIRLKYDTRYYKVVDPHFTIVFPVFNIKQNEFIEDVIKSSKDIEKFNFILKCAVLVKDSFSEYTDVFLVPDEGYGNFVKLHNKLYSGLLRNDLRLDISFIPHIGIGGNPDPLESKRVADSLNELNFTIKGRIEKLTIINYNYPIVAKLKEITLL
jgi:2'-5' RNA ligase superfamily